MWPLHLRRAGQGQIICYLYFNLDISDSWHLCHTYQCKLTNKNSSALVSIQEFYDVAKSFFCNEINIVPSRWSCPKNIVRLRRNKKPNASFWMTSRKVMKLMMTRLILDSACGSRGTSLHMDRSRSISCFASTPMPPWWTVLKVKKQTRMVNNPLEIFANLILAVGKI